MIRSRHVPVIGWILGVDDMESVRYSVQWTWDWLDERCSVTVDMYLVHETAFGSNSVFMSK